MPTSGNWRPRFCTTTSASLSLSLSLLTSLPPGGGSRELPRRRLSHEGTRRDAFYSSSSSVLSCERRESAPAGLSGESIDWVSGRAVLRRFAESPLSYRSRANMSGAAWDMSHCWCSCGVCEEVVHVCPLGLATGMAAMMVAVSLSAEARVANFANVKGICSSVDPYVLLFESLPPWSELLHSAWPLFGVMTKVAEQLRLDGFNEANLWHIFMKQRERQKLPKRQDFKDSSFCDLLGYASLGRCPLRVASDLLARAVKVAEETAAAHVDFESGESFDLVDTIDALVSRAQDLVYGLLPRVAGSDACKRSQNLGLGLLLSDHGIFQKLAQLQRLMEGLMEALPPKRTDEVGGNAAQRSNPTAGTAAEESSSDDAAFCGVGDARWQGEWLFETDFLSDLSAEFEAFMLAQAGDHWAVPAGLGSLRDEALESQESRPSGEEVRRREAYVAVLFAGPEVPRQQVLLHAEVIRTLAYSIKAVSRRQRPFVVLAELGLDAAVQAELEKAGLNVSTFDPAQLHMNVPEEKEWTMSWWRARSLRPTMGQLAGCLEPDRVRHCGNAGRRHAHGGGLRRTLHGPRLRDVSRSHALGYCAPRQWREGPAAEQRRARGTPRCGALSANG
eukprot:TRINITY_DN50340_c0_g1_i1.p1 TRINITY_DN50340_c0_g1~~TRINITY_DN50340_c0_g1_i1.p1  ORF type:complete len:617 (+),score=127.61 TRINITY_DN50340_c0_g1_i1:97-1947(+)